ncbi:dynein regulatory complex subunit 2 isoform X2 [Cryptotermes secundus]|nr:dynein regulatory complex subunit 2 isoform X2 [Cryptotermes secundus]
MESKNHVIENLLKELDQSEEQYARNFQSHAETIDQLIVLHAKQLEELREAYVRDKKSLTLEALREEQRILSGAKYNEEHLQTINFQMQEDMKSWISVWKENHTLKSDEVRNNMLSVTDWVQHDSKSKLENLWKEFQDTLQEYINSTEDKRNQYAELKAQDELSSETISKQSKILTYFYELITRLKKQLASLKMLQKQKIDDLKAQHSYYGQYFFSLRNQLVYNKKFDEKQLSFLIVSSNEVIKELELLCEKGERILHLASVCRRMETEREKVLPFVTSPHTSTILSQVEQDHLETAYKEVPKEPLAKEVFNYMKLDNFWRRYNRAYLERAALSLHKETLILENQQLTRALQQYLATMAQGKHHSPLLGTSLSVARPVSTHIIREHINLMPNTGEEKEKCKRQPKVRPVTCIEANTSVAVRHMLRCGAFQT